MIVNFEICELCELLYVMDALCLNDERMLIFAKRLSGGLCASCIFKMKDSRSTCLISSSNISVFFFVFIDTVQWERGQEVKPGLKLGSNSIGSANSSDIRHWKHISCPRS